MFSTGNPRNLGFTNFVTGRKPGGGSDFRPRVMITLMLFWNPDRAVNNLKEPTNLIRTSFC